MELLDVPEPGEPGPGEVIVRPQAVGICGSDFHFFLGELGDGSEFPRVQGHEVAAKIEAVGPEGSKGFRTGDSVILHPLSSCGHCYPCRVGRGNVCDNFSLIGIHKDGGLQELLRMSEAQVFPTSDPPSPLWPSRCRSQCAPCTGPGSIPASTSWCSAPVPSARR